MRAGLSAVVASVVTMKWRLDQTTGDLFQLLNRTGEYGAPSGLARRPVGRFGGTTGLDAQLRAGTWWRERRSKSPRGVAGREAGSSVDVAHRRRPGSRADGDCLVAIAGRDLRATCMHNMVFRSSLCTPRDPDGVVQQWRRVRDAWVRVGEEPDLTPDLGSHHRR